MHPQGRVRQGNVREAKTQTCKLEVCKHLKRFHSPLENHSSSSASPKVERRGEKWRKKNAGERCQQDHGKISREAQRRRQTQETEEEWGRRPQTSWVLSLHCPATDADTTTPTTSSSSSIVKLTAQRTQQQRHPGLGRSQHCSASVPHAQLEVPKYLPLPVPHERAGDREASLTFAFFGPKAAGSVRPSIVGDVGRCLLVTLCLWDLPVNLIRQVPKEANTVLHKLGITKEKVQWEKRMTSDFLAHTCFHDSDIETVILKKHSSTH